MDNNHYKLSQLLKKKRHMINKSQGEVALESGISVSTLSKYERGDAFPSDEKLLLILKSYRISKEELYKALSGDLKNKIENMG